MANKKSKSKSKPVSRSQATPRAKAHHRKAESPHVSAGASKRPIAISERVMLVRDVKTPFEAAFSPIELDFFRRSDELCALHASGSRFGETDGDVEASWS